MSTTTASFKSIEMGKKSDSSKSNIESQKSANNIPNIFQGQNEYSSDEDDSFVFPKIKNSSSNFSSKKNIKFVTRFDNKRIKTNAINRSRKNNISNRKQIDTIAVNFISDSEYSEFDKNNHNETEQIINKNKTKLPDKTEKLAGTMFYFSSSESDSDSVRIKNYDPKYEHTNDTSNKSSSMDKKKRFKNDINTILESDQSDDIPSIEVFDNRPEVDFKPHSNKNNLIENEKRNENLKDESKTIEKVESPRKKMISKMHQSQKTNEKEIDHSKNDITNTKNNETIRNKRLNISGKPIPRIKINFSDSEDESQSEIENEKNDKNENNENDKIDIEKKNETEIDDKKELQNESSKPSQIENESIKSSQIENESLKLSQIEDESNKPPKNEDELIKPFKIENESIKQSKIENESIKPSKIENESIKSSQIEKEINDNELQLDDINESIENDENDTDSAQTDFESGVTDKHEIERLRSTFMKRLPKHEVTNDLIPYRMRTDVKMTFRGKKLRFTLFRGDTALLSAKLKTKNVAEPFVKIFKFSQPNKEKGRSKDKNKSKSQDKPQTIAIINAISNFSIFSLRKDQIDTKSEDIMTVKYTSPKVESAPRIVDVHFSNPPDSIPQDITSRKPKFTYGTMWMLDLGGRVAKRSNKNCIMIDESGREVMSVIKTKDSEVSIEAFPQIGEICVFAFGISSVLCKA